MASSYSSVTVQSTATVIFSANNDRKGTLLQNTSAGTVFIGMDNSVTTANGFPILQNATFNNSGQNAVWKGAIYGIVASGTSDVRIWEFSP